MQRFLKPLRSHHVFYTLIAASILLMLVAGAVSWSSARETRSSVQWAQHSEQVLTQGNRVLATLGDSESFGLRWLLSMRVEYLMQYTDSMNTLDADISTLQQLVTDSSPQRARADDLTRVAATRRAWTDETVRQVLQTQTSGEAERVVAVRISAGGGGNLAAQMRSVTEALLVHERNLRAERSALMDESLSESSTTVLVAIVLALVAGLVALLATRQSRLAWVREREAEWEKERAEAANQQKSLFLATMSHEIRTPMNAIFGFSQLLSRQVKDPKAIEYVRAIRASGQSLLALINDLLDLSKIEAGRMQLYLVPTDVHDLVETTLTVFHEAAADKRLMLEVDVDPVLPSSLLVDPHRLRQILVNLVSNAVKYTTSGSVSVRLSSQQVGPGTVSLELCVADTGVGIEKDQLALIFDPFHRTENAEISSTEGTGLGLSIVRRLVELMDGELTVQSELGRGSRFTVRLGAVTVARRMPESASRPREVNFSNLRASRILVVDDVALNRELIRAYLSDSGHELAFAEDGLQAVEKAVAWDANVVLMDIRMPKLDGRKAAERIRARAKRAGVLIVAITASSMSGDEDWARRIFDGYLRKPMSAQDLYDCLAKLLPRRMAGAELVEETVVASEAAGDALSEPQPDAIEAVAEMLSTHWPPVRSSMRLSEVQKLLAQLRALLPRCGEPSWVSLCEQASAAMDAFRIEDVERLLNELQDTVSRSQAQG